MSPSGIRARGQWDYDKNRDGILKYWEERVQENGQYENTYTIGMRGIHDSPMPGGGTMADKVARLQHVIDDQRAMLARDINPNVDQVPQIFVPYKEVLTIYQNGLQVPPDVTLVWPDDNHGYIRELSTRDGAEAPGRRASIIMSPTGAPRNDYLWLCTTPPALIWEEMHKAYDNGARTVWVLNVGGLKEIGDRHGILSPHGLGHRLMESNGAARLPHRLGGANFRQKHAADIAAILDEYFRLNYPSKPEHLLQAQFTDNYNEKARRLQWFAQLVEENERPLRSDAAGEERPLL
jgi:hypothetical protein